MLHRVIPLCWVAFWYGLACASLAPAGSSVRTSESEAPVSSKKDICGFTAPVVLGEVGADGLVEVPPNHPHIFTMGRIDCRDPAALAFAFPGVSLRARFEGDALDLRLEDFGGGTEQDTNYYDVIIDDGPPALLEARPGTHIYELARQLGPGPHDVEIVKRVESNHGRGAARFLGLRVREGTTLLPVRARSRRLEFIGDSITCGYGNELCIDDPTNHAYTTKNSNARMAYGAITARRLDAEYVAVAASGRGVSRNYAGEPGILAPELHELTLPDDPAAPLWEHGRYQPDATIINLGTNDYSTPGVDRARFRERYVQLLIDLRRRYPHTILVVAVGPMLNDEYPPGEQAWTKIRSDVADVLAERKNAGERQLFYIEFEPHSAPFGEDWHPCKATHQRMADALSAELERLMKW
jgi:lysophospholipase L1-like esterase